LCSLGHCNDTEDEFDGEAGSDLLPSSHSFLDSALASSGSDYVSAAENESPLTVDYETMAAEYLRVIGDRLQVTISACSTTTVLLFLTSFFFSFLNKL